MSFWSLLWSSCKVKISAPFLQRSSSFTSCDRQRRLFRSLYSGLFTGNLKYCTSSSHCTGPRQNHWHPGRRTCFNDSPLPLSCFLSLSFLSVEKPPRSVPSFTFFVYVSFWYSLHEVRRHRISTTTRPSTTVVPPVLSFCRTRSHQCLCYNTYVVNPWSACHCCGRLDTDISRLPTYHRNPVRSDNIVLPRLFFNF